MTYLEPALPYGLKGGFLFLTMVFLITPASLFITGIASESLRDREDHSSWKPWILYMAGFLGTGIAIFLIILGMYRDPYVPYMAPGLQAHLIFLAGMEIVYLPVLIILSIFFAFFALAGGFFAHRRSGRAGKA